MHRLLDIYVKSRVGREPMHGAAVWLLHCHGASLDPLQVLEVCLHRDPLFASTFFSFLGVSIQCTDILMTVISVFHLLPPVTRRGVGY